MENFGTSSSSRDIFTQTSEERMERFAKSTNADIKRYKEMAKNENTTKSTNKWMNCYRSWAKYRNQPNYLYTGFCRSMGTRA